MKPISTTLFLTPLIIAAAMLAGTSGALADAAASGCPAPSPASTSLAYNPFGVTIPWAKTSAPGMDVYAGVASDLDAATRNRLEQQAQSTGTGTLVLFAIDVSTPNGFPKLVGIRGNGKSDMFKWPFSRLDRVVEQNGQRFYRLALTLRPGCWNFQAELNGATAPVLSLSVP